MQEKENRNDTVKTGEEAGLLPVVALRGLVALPHIVMDFEVGRTESRKAVDAALAADRRILLLTQRDQRILEPKPKDLFRIGVICEIRQVVRSAESSRVLVEGRRRAKATALYMPGETEYWTAEYKELPLSSRIKANSVEMQAIINSVKGEYANYCRLSRRIPADFVEMVLTEEKPEQFFEAIWSNMEMDYHDRQTMIEENSIFLRLTMLYAVLVRENEVLRAEQDIQNKVQQRIDAQQRELYLREQLRAIKDELGELSGGLPSEQDFTDGGDAQSTDHIGRLKKIKEYMPKESADKIMHEIKQLMNVPPFSQEASVIVNYLETVFGLPWGVSTKEKLDIVKAAAQLERDHYGLQRVKERILESMSVRVMKPDLTGQIICLVGPPGVGKTSIAKSVAKALGRNYVRISLGGIRDEAEIRGHRKTYVGAMPGRIIDAMRQAKSMNPLILLDEIDKLSGDHKGDPAAALLEVLDSAQNSTFRDHYLEIPFDLSQVLFLTTANDASQIPAPLFDRMDVIELNSYTRLEKFHIAKEHLVKKQLHENGLKASQIRITDAALYDLIDYYTREAGVRTLERRIASLCRKAAKSLLTEDVKKVQYTPETLETALGPHKFTGEYFSQEDAVGIVNGLAWTSVGGVVMPLEVLTMPGKGEIQVTGSLGDVMKESARLAISYVRSVAKEYDINPEHFKTRDIHIHAPEGAVPKDGPSAGVTMLTALISALSGVPVRHDVAMTGEITLHGKVLPIGGLVEKSMAAYKNGIRTVLIPAANLPDLAELDETIRSEMTFIPCETVDTVLHTVLKPRQYDTKLEPLNPDELQKVKFQPISAPRKRKRSEPAQ
ncbi:MAG: endopeptidase La [Oscillospiraceae bacterium]|nr:endopeptidase La [Oscillospiraceae bacterium]